MNRRGFLKFLGVARVWNGREFKLITGPTATAVGVPATVNEALGHDDPREPTKPGHLPGCNYPAEHSLDFEFYGRCNHYYCNPNGVTKTQVTPP